MHRSLPRVAAGKSRAEKSRTAAPDVVGCVVQGPPAEGDFADAEGVQAGQQLPHSFQLGPLPPPGSVGPPRSWLEGLGGGRHLADQHQAWSLLLLALRVLKMVKIPGRSTPAAEHDNRVYWHSRALGTSDH